MAKEYFFDHMQELQKLYCHGAKTLSRCAPQYISARQAFITAAIFFSMCELDVDELHIWLDLNSITAADDMDFITSIAADAIDFVLDKYSCVLTPEFLSNGYLAPLDRLRRAIVEHSAISS